MKKSKISTVTFIPNKTNIEMRLELESSEQFAIDLSIDEAKEFVDSILAATQYADLPENKE